MSLGPRDQTKLARIVQLAREIELTWPSGNRHSDVDQSSNPRYQELKREIAACTDAETESLSRLTKAAAHLHDQVSLAHFFACLVPFERLSSRALRDDEFLVEEGDGGDKVADRVPLKLIVENLRSAFNVGALFRTSECLGISEILLCGYTPGPDDDKTMRTAMGTAAMVPWRRVDRTRTACEELRKEGYKIVALETAANAVSLHDFKFTAAPLAFVLGNERFGLEGDTLQAVDAVCRIPVRGIKNSMNVGVAFGITAFEWLRQYEAKL
ncbi:MAG: TrmH family RNA methyltransferase [Bdellovibrionales bacterium]|nr:TrmH family RNA methyltransferase [Bdellovibrionales bacterium]